MDYFYFFTPTSIYFILSNFFAVEYFRIGDALERISFLSNSSVYIINTFTSCQLIYPADASIDFFLITILSTLLSSLLEHDYWTRGTILAWRGLIQCRIRTEIPWTKCSSSGRLFYHEYSFYFQIISGHSFYLQINLKSFRTNYHLIIFA